MYFTNITFTLKQKQETFFLISVMHFSDLQTKQSQNIQIVQMSENFFRKKQTLTRTLEDNNFSLKENPLRQKRGLSKIPLM